jgi:hypothetical protein
MQQAGMQEGSMMLRSCPREAEVKALVERGQWPQACAPELRAHVSNCRQCSELSLVSVAFQRARNQAMGAAKLGSPGLLWWRAQLRRRNAAVERISRPILSAQIFALVVNLVVASAVAVWQAKHGLAWLTWLEQLPRNVDSHWFSSLMPTDIFNSGTGSVLGPTVLIAVSAVALVGGVVVYFASEKQ